MSFSILPLAHAATAAGGTQQHGMGLGFILMWVGLLVILYFLMWRPQSKRMKEQKRMLGNLNKGDEVVTSGGMLGQIIKVSDDFIVLNIANEIDINVQKQAVAAVLQKGTIKAI